MPYIMKTVTAGRVVEVQKHYSARWGKKCERAPNREPTREEQIQVNLRHAEEKLRWLINTNFGVGDWHLVIGYNRKYNRTPQQARRDLERFLRGYREYCKENGIPVRYITVTEYEAKRIHHHLVIGSIPTTVLNKLWTFGRPHITPLDSTGDYTNLANYLIKETARTFSKPDSATKKRWTQSKGLKKPTIKRCVIAADKWLKEPKVKKGYYILKDSIVNGVHEVTGMPFQQYRMIRESHPRAGPKGGGKP